MFCGYCGKENAEDYNFCAKCGKPKENEAPSQDTIAKSRLDPFFVDCMDIVSLGLNLFFGIRL